MAKLYCHAGNIQKLCRQPAGANHCRWEQLPICQSLAHCFTVQCHPKSVTPWNHNEPRPDQKQLL
ncbi:hypothetical protein FRX31_011864 [Thalictrum thalictroides]|uniref:Uncharacterized protein n=1 Tax=Thalictrum thalictroides TaxID=46969 RepID=A0A7J6WMF8_THATH|nr:hypothetical protein FRX31_011864 [Thalictrum thalictroides]